MLKLAFYNGGALEDTHGVRSLTKETNMGRELFFFKDVKHPKREI